MTKHHYPTITISDQGAYYVERGQLWMYRNNLVALDDSVPNGAPIDMIKEDGTYLGTGFLSKASHILVRILTTNKEDALDKDFFKKRLKFAYDYRKTVEAENFDNCRLVFSEADQLPGLVVDRYNHILVTQISTYGMEQIKDMLYELLLELFEEDGITISGIYERNDVPIRQKEGLQLYKGFYHGIKMMPVTIIEENGLKLKVDIENGQKTGYFLDQKSNRVLLRKMAKDKTVLDCFSHTGGFALNAAYGNAKHVTAVDVSKTALDQGYENACLNNLQDRIDFVQADVFDYLKTLKKGQFDIIVLDPPAFTKSRRTIDHAYNGYKNINAMAMNALGNGGYLITCSCSRFMEMDNFEKMLREAALETHITLRQVSVTQQNHDHPILWTMEETSYLKFYIFQIIK